MLETQKKCSNVYRFAFVYVRFFQFDSFSVDYRSQSCEGLMCIVLILAWISHVEALLPSYFLMMPSTFDSKTFSYDFQPPLGDGQGVIYLNFLRFT